MSLLFEIFLSFLKIGLLGFGGGYAMMSIIITESVRFGISLAQMANLAALEMVIPGPIAINAATYVGYLANGLGGSIVATIAVSIPSLIYVNTMLHFKERFKDAPLFNIIFDGIKPAAVGLIAAAALLIAQEVIIFNGSVHFIRLGFFGMCALLIMKFKVDPILLTVIAGIVGGLIF